MRVLRPRSHSRVSSSPKHGRVSPEDVAQARAASLSDADIVEVVASVAINVFTNYLNIAADTDVDFPPVAKLPANA
jgi:alkylhydroperoxidase family enzyme